FLLVGSSTNSAKPRATIYILNGHRRCCSWQVVAWRNLPRIGSNSPARVCVSRTPRPNCSCVKGEFWLAPSGPTRHAGAHATSEAGQGSERRSTRQGRFDRDRWRGWIHRRLPGSVFSRQGLHTHPGGG